MPYRGCKYSGRRRIPLHQMTFKPRCAIRAVSRRGVSPSLILVSAEAWVVECTGCKCLIVCCGIDPQVEHGQTKPATAPISSTVLNCPCCNSDYRYGSKDIIRGNPKRNPACSRKHQPPKRDGAVVIAASIVAAIRLRGEAITNSPKVTAAVSDSLQLARMVMARLERGS